MGKVVEKISINKTIGCEFYTKCPECRRKNKHTVLASADHQYSEDYDEYSTVSGEDNYQVIQCNCGHFSFRLLNWCSEYQDIDWNGQSETIYPQIDSDELDTKKFKFAPDIIQQIYFQTIKAFNKECHILCAAGLRGIVEGICAAKGVESGTVEYIKPDGSKKENKSKNLDGKICGLAEQAIITKEYADILHEHRFLGNYAVHELTQPSPKELRAAIEIIEHIIEQIFEIPKKAELLTSRRLSRVGK